LGRLCVLLTAAKIAGSVNHFIIVVPAPMPGKHVLSISVGFRGRCKAR
jgi:hypothetical protein